MAPQLGAEVPHVQPGVRLDAVTLLGKIIDEVKDLLLDPRVQLILLRDVSAIPAKGIDCTNSLS